MRKIPNSNQPTSRNSIFGALGALALLAAGDPAFSASSVHADELPHVIVVTEKVHLERIAFDQSLLPEDEQAGFGSLLFDLRGRLVLHRRTKTWLFTTGLASPAPMDKRNWYGEWISEVREFDARTLRAGPKKVALRVSGADHWSVIHDVVQVAPNLIVAFYSANGGVRAATSSRPDQPFKADPNFLIRASDSWEQSGGEQTTLESNGAHVLIDEDQQAATVWLGYDSYHVDKTAGQLGWAKVRIDKRARTVEFLGKNPANPLPLLREGYLAARCGGNLSTEIRLGGQRAFFYYSRPNVEHIMLTLALSPDALFRHVTRLVDIEPPLGDEVVIEKFETYLLDGRLHLIYENRLKSDRWGTAARVYKITDRKGIVTSFAPQ